MILSLIAYLTIVQAQAAEPAQSTQVAFFIEDLQIPGRQDEAWVPPNARESRNRHLRQLRYRLGEPVPTPSWTTPSLERRDRVTPRSAWARVEQQRASQRQRSQKREYLRPTNEYLKRGPSQTSREPSAMQRSTDHILGNISAPISLVVYTDFECPFCQRHHPVLMELHEQYGDLVNIIYRHFPLAFHPNARNASLSAECAAAYAADTGFYDYAELLFEQGVDPANYVDYATSITIDGPSFQRCYETEQFAHVIESSIEEGNELGVMGTPTTFVVRKSDGEVRQVSGAQSIENFMSVIDDLLGKS